MLFSSLISEIVDCGRPHAICSSAHIFCRSFDGVFADRWRMCFSFVDAKTLLAALSVFHDKPIDGEASMPVLKSIACGEAVLVSRSGGASGHFAWDAASSVFIPRPAVPPNLYFISFNGFCLLRFTHRLEDSPECDCVPRVCMGTAIARMTSAGMKSVFHGEAEGVCDTYFSIPSASDSIFKKLSSVSEGLAVSMRCPRADGAFSMDKSL